MVLSQSNLIQIVIVVPLEIGPFFEKQSGPRLWIGSDPHATNLDARDFKALRVGAKPIEWRFDSVFDSSDPHRRNWICILQPYTNGPTLETLIQLTMFRSSLQPFIPSPSTRV